MILWGTQSQTWYLQRKSSVQNAQMSCEGWHRALWSSVLRISTVKRDSGNLTQYSLGSRMFFAQQASFQRVWKQGWRHGSVALSGDRNVPSLIVSCGRPADFSESEWSHSPAGVRPRWLDSFTGLHPEVHWFLYALYIFVYQTDKSWRWNSTHNYL